MTAVRSDIEIAQAATLEPIQAIGLKLGIPADVLIPYGRDKAKIADDFIRANGHARDGKLVLVTAISPTPAGEGKTTTTVGLRRRPQPHRPQGGELPARAEPRPVLRHEGRRGGRRLLAGRADEDINLHFTGDFHAIGAAHNLLAALVDNHLYWSNELRFDPRRVVAALHGHERPQPALDNMGLGGVTGTACVREGGFDITPASEMMAILCLARIALISRRLGKIVSVTAATTRR